MFSVHEALSFSLFFMLHLEKHIVIGEISMSNRFHKFHLLGQMALQRFLNRF
ncbi:hypothetical protein PAE4_10708 [Bacillus altitudinis]|nr:hypothetical protein PAE4_10708 [Bacillus altitudinis]